MNDSSKGTPPESKTLLPIDSEKLMYLVPADGASSGGARDVDLLELWKILWRRKLLIVAITAVFALSSVVYALLATEWYRAEVVLAPTDSKSTQGLAAQLGGIASLAGITVGSTSTAEPLAVLGSRDFARSFIEDYDLVKVLFDDEWDESTDSWKSNDPKKQPDIREAVKYFRDNVRTVRQDINTGLVTLTIEWKNPVLAAAWANVLVRRLNESMRERAIAEAQANIDYLQAELASTNLVTLQQSIGRLIESEVQKLMLARGHEEFVFRVVDTADVPHLRHWPKRTLIVLLATFLGGTLGAAIAISLDGMRRRHGSSD